MEALSKGGRVVAHSTNGGKLVHLFHRFEDSELRTAFEGPWRATAAPLMWFPCCGKSASPDL
ncbi:DUF6461 domain-containing protein [Streptomyces sp. NBC_00690]|uniref:DUF6461 domain-containing protein n=1 Tax=Streptomyces sp. NBC_00690 TaxID=2975808 RepID=UPI002E2C1DF7|nr:DUF6461 domain-containing protein [Streptomyces sp. NBC_00690]